MTLLRDEIERRNQSVIVDDLKSWVEKYAPWKSGGLVDIGQISDTDRYDALLRTLRRAQLVSDDTIDDNESLPPALCI